MNFYKQFSLSILIIAFAVNAQAQQVVPEYSKAGFFEIPNSGREVFDFNVGWRFYKGAISNAERKDFQDSNWDIVNTPHGLELNSIQASGSNNYQGEAWYRKHFTIPSEIKNKRLVLHFEAVMGKCKVWLNGELLASHFGGYLPFSVDISNHLKKNEENSIAIWVDNSDDASYPPGKPQKHLDFSYFGGIYRDVWLVATNNLFITNPNSVDKVAGGGLFVHFEDLSKENVLVVIDTDVANNIASNQKISVQYILKDLQGTIISNRKVKGDILPQNYKQFRHEIEVKKPKLWSPQNPHLYSLEVRIFDRKNEVVDGIRQKIGIRKIEFKGKDGFYLNNEPYNGKLMGVNRHQDFALIGNALPNSGQWRDALLLKQASSDIVRAAHYPADPAFMDACDALGLFYIVATPGWQFWNDASSFEKGVYSDIKNMVRRDRNHPAVLMWEPILNETYYPSYFAEKVHNLVHEEYPYQGAYTVCDEQARGQEFFDVIYSHPFKGSFWDTPLDYTKENSDALAIDYSKENRSIFTREWGDSVDDWNSHNSPSRASRNWGENAQLTQVNHYAKPSFVFTSWEALYNTPKQHIGGALWHAFDHQRGYHPDPFYGGITDVFRQPKYSYYLFKSQRNIEESEPMIYIAHEMTPFSSADVSVFTNCDEIRLIKYERDTIIKKVDRTNFNMPSPITVFKDVFDFSEVKALHRKGKQTQVSFEAQGLVNGKVVVSIKKKPALRPDKIQLKVIDNGIPLVANGSDIIVVAASVVDDKGNIKRLNNSFIQFEIEGEATLIGDETIMANPVKVEWGTAPIILKSTVNAGNITIKASVIEEGINTPLAGELTITSLQSKTKMLYLDVTKSNNIIDKSSINQLQNTSNKKLEQRIIQLEKELNKYKLKMVEKQQEDFEGAKKKIKD